MKSYRELFKRSIYVVALGQALLLLSLPLATVITWLHSANKCADSSCLIHPTFHPEGMSNVILEAASTARPVITTCRHGCMEAVDEGVTGFLFEERDTEGLIAKIEKFLAMPMEARAERSRKARIKMEREFDRQLVVDAYLDEIDKIKPQ